MTPPLRFSMPAEELSRASEALLADATSRLDEIERAAGPPTLDSTLRPLDRVMLEVSDLGSHGSFVFVTHPDPARREAGRGVGESTERFFTALRLRPALYRALQGVPAASLDPAARHAVEKLLKEMRRAGVELSESERAEVRALNDSIEKLSNQFQENISEKVRSIEVAGPAELEGLPPDYIASHRPGSNGRIQITTRYPDALPVFAYADRADLRRRLILEFMNRAYPENLAVLTDLLGRRYELARRLGYPTFADLVLEDKMMGSTTAAWAFLDRVGSLLTTSAATYRARLLERKRRDEPSATRLEAWDGGGWYGHYYPTKLRNEDFGVDPKILRRYLPYVAVRDGLLSLCERLFELEIVRTTSNDLWHPTVEVYDVRHRGAPLGRFYLDLVPREGKYSHAAQFTLRTGIKGRQLPEAALVCNFIDPSTPVESARMEYSDVVTFFHEFGHLLHALFSGHGDWLYNSQGYVEWDFIEAPSQLFEEWARDPNVLKEFARDPDTGTPIPLELLQRMKAAESLGRANAWLVQLGLSAVSLGLYDRDPTGLDPSAFLREAFGRFNPVPPPDGTHPVAGFGHLTGYSAIYYTYTWSLVIARDLLRAFHERGSLTDPALARRYVETILKPGGSKPAAELAADFLGRPFTFDAFEKWALIDPYDPPATPG